jgi:hypothetical protein
MPERLLLARRYDSFSESLRIRKSGWNLILSGMIARRLRKRHLPPLSRLIGNGPPGAHRLPAYQDRLPPQGGNLEMMD